MYKYVDVIDIYIFQYIESIEFRPMGILLRILCIQSNSNWALLSLVYLDIFEFFVSALTLQFSHGHEQSDRSEI